MELRPISCRTGILLGNNFSAAIGLKRFCLFLQAITLELILAANPSVTINHVIHPSL